MTLKKIYTLPLSEHQLLILGMLVDEGMTVTDCLTHLVADSVTRSIFDFELSDLKLSLRKLAPSEFPLDENILAKSDNIRVELERIINKETA